MATRPRLYPSPLPYDDACRTALVAALSPLAIDVQAIASAARLAHWSVRGPMTATLHASFGAFYASLAAEADTLSEYVRMLGAQPVGTVADVAAASRLPGYPAATVDGLAHCAALFEQSSAFLALADAAATVCNDEGAPDALDLVTTTIEVVAKAAGFIGDHLVPEGGAE